MASNARRYLDAPTSNMYQDDLPGLFSAEQGFRGNEIPGTVTQLLASNSVAIVRRPL